MCSYTSSKNSLGSKVGIYIGLYAIMNNYCIVRACNDFYLPAALKIFDVKMFSWMESSYEEFST